MIKDFNSFISEARGFSEPVNEYARLILHIMNHSVSEFFSNTKKSNRYKKDILINDAYLEVTEETSREFTIDNIKIHFGIEQYNLEASPRPVAYYQSNYDKVKITPKNNGQVDINITCILQIGNTVDRSELERICRDVIQHELTHAYNDYKEPNFLKNYRLGYTASYATQNYEFVNRMPTLNQFIQILYVLTDNEMKAIIGEREHFESLEEFNEYSGTKLARLGTSYDPEESYEMITEEAESVLKYPEKVIKTFGKFFVNIYKGEIDTSLTAMDPKILELENKDLLTILEYFEPYIKTRSQYLLRKLHTKLAFQGKGKLI